MSGDDDLNLGEAASCRVVGLPSEASMHGRGRAPSDRCIPLVVRHFPLQKRSRNGGAAVLLGALASWSWGVRCQRRHK